MVYLSIEFTGEHTINAKRHAQKLLDQVKELLNTGKLPLDGETFSVWENDPKQPDFAEVFGQVSVNKMRATLTPA